MQVSTMVFSGDLPRSIPMTCPLTFPSASVDSYLRTIEAAEGSRADERAKAELARGI